jgi:predicted dienelactone hydrolase
MQHTMRAVTPILLTALCLTLCSPHFSHADTPTSRPSFTTVDDTWHDAARNRDVPVRIYLPADASKPWQTILVSHGLGDSRAAMAYACKPWAADNFLVVALEHPGSDWHIWDDAKKGEEFKRLSKAANVANFVLRCGDVRFALDQLAEWNAKGGRLAGKIDLDHIGLAGHSFGALTAQAIIGEQFEPVAGQPMAFRDERVKASVIMSPGVEGALSDIDAAYGGITVPTLFLTGTADVSPGLGITLSSRRRVPFDRAIASDRFLLIFDRGDHLVFSGVRTPRAHKQRYGHIQTVVARVSTDFWNAMLRNDPLAPQRLMDRTRGGLDDADRLEHRSPTTRPTAQPTQ